MDIDYKMLCLTPFTVENSQYKFNPDKYTKYINVPCGKCEACLQLSHTYLINLSRLELAEMMFKCAYMRTSPNDDTTCKSLLDKYEVVVND